jgi:hypothetical protein
MHHQHACIMMHFGVGITAHTHVSICPQEQDVGADEGAEGAEEAEQECDSGLD